jgi:hypothetical protein
LYDDAINSPQSQKDAVGSIVARYVAHDATSTATATIQFHLLNVFLSISINKVYKVNKNFVNRVAVESSC